MAILLADDEPDDLRSWKEVLEDHKHSVVVATSYDEAEQCLNEGGFDVAVLDLYLMGRSREGMGVQLAKRFGQRLPVIILTAEDTSAAAKESLQGEACDYISKAAGAQALLAAVEKALKRRVFVVHGHDPRFLNEVRDFLRSKHLWPIVLQEEPGGGRTIIEKVEQYSNVAFAVVLFSPDDAGGKQLRPGKVDTLRQRPRQNVVFELGFFVGKLGRKRTVVLRADPAEIEMLSDYGGVQFISTSVGNWRDVLVREMKAGGIEVR
jgi:predicted nucleotide-binding protein